MERSRFFRRPLFLVLVAVGIVVLVSWALSGPPSYTQAATSDVLTVIHNDPSNITKATIEDKEQTVDLELANKVRLQNGNESNKIQAQFPASSIDSVYGLLTTAQQEKTLAANATVDTKVSKESVLLTLLFNFLPIAAVVILLLFFMSQAQGGGSRVLNFGKSKAKLISKDTPKTTFADVAVAGEAGVPFYTISGSDFVEMFVGVGASRVRDLFQQAKENAPAIVFVDEIDAVGRHRGAGLGGGHDEREQTLNQLLVEMDGFDTKGGVILIAATNRPDILDPALLRPGRFDRQIAVDTPDMEGRKAILRVHAKGKPFQPDVYLDSVARRTPGFTGADLANVINEAALLTARSEKRAITNDFLEESIDRVVAGPARRTRVMSDREKKITAYHEGGHALVAYALPHAAPVHKVTILSRARSLGHTLVLPTEDKYTQTRAELIDTLAYALGGRAAEELVYHEPTTGAGNDIEKATSIARAMITEYGMSAKLGAVKYGQNDGEPFLGRTMGHQRDYSESVSSEIDNEVRGLIEIAHDEAWEILVEYRDVLDNLVLELMEKETVTQADMARICARVIKRPPIAPFHTFGKRKASDQPPVMTPAEIDALKIQAEADGAQAVLGSTKYEDGGRQRDR